MRILLVSDLRYTLKQLDWVAVGGRRSISSWSRRHPRHRVDRRADAQIAVVLEYLAVGGQDDGRRVLRQPRPQRENDADERPRWADGTRERASTSTGADRHRTRMVTVCPWWDGPQPATWSTASSRDDAAQVGTEVDLGVPRAARQVADELDRQAPLRRRATSTRGSRGISPRSCCAATSTSRRSSRRRWIDHIGSTVVLERRPPARPRTRAHRARPRRRRGGLVLVRGRRRAVLAAQLDSGRDRARSRAQLRRAPGRASTVPSTTSTSPRPLRGPRTAA